MSSHDLEAGEVNWRETSRGREAEMLSCAKYVRGIEVVDKERLSAAVQAEDEEACTKAVVRASLQRYTGEGL